MKCYVSVHVHTIMRFLDAAVVKACETSIAHLCRIHARKTRNYVAGHRKNKKKITVTFKCLYPTTEGKIYAVEHN